MRKFTASPHIQEAFEMRERGWVSASTFAEGEKSTLEQRLNKVVKKVGLTTSSTPPPPFQCNVALVPEKFDKKIGNALLEGDEEKKKSGNNISISFAAEAALFCIENRSALHGLSTKRGSNLFGMVQGQISNAAFGFEKHWGRLQRHTEEEKKLTETSQNFISPVIIEAREKIGAECLTKMGNQLSVTDKEIAKTSKKVNLDGMDYLYDNGMLREEVIMDMGGILREMDAGKQLFESEFGLSEMDAREEVEKRFTGKKELQDDLEEGIYQLSMQWINELQGIKYESPDDTEEYNEKLLKILELMMCHHSELFKEKLGNIQSFTGKRNDDLMQIFIVLDFITRSVRRSVLSTVLKNKDLPKAGTHNVLHEASGLIEVVTV